MTAILRTALFVLATAFHGAAPAQTVPVDEPAFTEHLAQRLRQHVGDTPVAVKGPLTLTLGSLQLNLDRVYRFCQRNAQGCDGELDRYTRNTAQFLKDRNAPPTREALRLIVRSDTYAKAAQATVQDIQPRPLVDGLVVMPALHLPSTLRMVTERDNKALGLSADEVFRIALENLKRELKPLGAEARPAARGEIQSLQGNAYHSSRLIAHEEWAPLARAQGGTLLVTAPATDAVLYISESAPPAVEALRKLAGDFAARARNPLSDVVLRWTPNGWQPVK